MTPKHEIVDHASQIEGWYPIEQLEVLYELAFQSAELAKHPYFLEIGTWYGRSAYVLASIAKDFKGTLLCVDTWKGLVHDPTDPRYKVAETTNVLAAAKMNLAELADHVQFLPGDSRKVLRGFIAPVFDLIHVDGDHTSPVVDQDVGNAWRLIKPGGVVCGDDFNEAAVSFAVARQIPLAETIHKVKINGPNRFWWVQRGG